jgi:hypothetical protein
MQNTSMLFRRICADHCHRSYEATDRPSCAYGKIGSNRRVVLFGDSHAAQWFQPIRLAAENQGWELRLWTKYGCPFIDTTMWSLERKVVYTGCDEWRRNNCRQLSELKPDLVVLASLARYSERLFSNGVLSGAAEGRVAQGSYSDDRNSAQPEVKLRSYVTIQEWRPLIEAACR